MRKTIITGCYSNILLVSLCLGQQRVAPGVPPQHYQQQQPPPQYDPQQQQHISNQQVHRQGGHQVPVQQVHQGQVPTQQVHQGQVPAQQVHQGQVPAQQVHQGQVPAQPMHQKQLHGHHHPQPNQILNTANIAAEKQHIQEHMDVPIDTSKMTDQELQFHYFKMHDADNNNKLDGCELIKSLIHWHGPDSKELAPETVTSMTDEQLVGIVDPLFDNIDINKDGYVDYTEFKKYVG